MNHYEERVVDKELFCRPNKNLPWRLVTNRDLLLKTQRLESIMKNDKRRLYERSSEIGWLRMELINTGISESKLKQMYKNHPLYRDIEWANK